MRACSHVSHAPIPLAILVTLHVLEDLGVLEAQRDPLLPNDPQKRKAVPLYSGLAKYFPDALAAVAELSLVGGQQHHPGEPLHWDRAKSTDELDAAMRHLFEAGTIDSDGTRHSTKLAWRALANLQKELEQPVARDAVPAQPAVSFDYPHWCTSAGDRMGFLEQVMQQAASLNSCGAISDKSYLRLRDDCLNEMRTTRAPGGKPQ